MGIFSSVETPPKATEKILKEASNLLPQAIEMFEKTLESIPPEQVPDEASLEFGIVFKADTSLSLAKTASESAFKITLEWVKDED